MAEKKRRSFVEIVTALVLGGLAWLLKKNAQAPAPAATTASAAQDQSAGQIIAETPTAPVQQVIVGNTLDTSEPDVAPGPVPTFTVGEPSPSVSDEGLFGVDDDIVTPLPRSVDDSDREPEIIAPVTAPVLIEPLPVPVAALGVTILDPLPSATVSGQVKWAALVTGIGSLSIAPEVDSVNLVKSTVEGGGTVSGTFDAGLFAPGLHTLYVRVTDSTGKTMRVSVPFVVALPPVTQSPVTTPVIPAPAVPAPARLPPLPSGLPPEVPAWQQNMAVIGKQKGQQFVTAAATGKPDLALAYDPARVFEQIAEHTGDPAFYLYADTALKMYRDGYVFPNNGGVSGIYRFTRGMRLHHDRTGDPKDAQAIQLVRDNGAYAQAPLEWTADVGRQREVAYLINAYTDAAALGLPNTAWGPARHGALIDQAYGHLRQMRDPVNGWKNGAAAGDGGAQISPFMFALTADALIDDWRQTRDPRLIPELAATADFIWANAWRAAEQAMTYNINPKNTTGDLGNLAVGSPDLNLLIAPVYEFLYQETGDQVDRDRADALFLGGVDTGALTPYGYAKGAWITGGNPKQFMESYKTSFDQVASRWGVLGAPVTQPVLIAPAAPVTQPVLIAPLPVPVAALGVTILDPLPSATVSGQVTWAAVVTGVGALTVSPEVDSVNLVKSTVEGGGTVSGTFDAGLFAPGLHTLYVRVTDVTGKTLRVSVPFVVAAPPVVVPVVVPAPVVVAAPSGPLAARFTAPVAFSEQRGTINAVLEITNPSGAITVTPTMDSTTLPAIRGVGTTVTIPINTAALSNSGHRLGVVVTDSAGRTVTASVNFFAVNTGSV